MNNRSFCEQQDPDRGVADSPSPTIASLTIPVRPRITIHA